MIEQDLEIQAMLSILSIKGQKENLKPLVIQKS